MVVVVAAATVFTITIPPKEKGWQKLDIISILSKSVHLSSNVSI